MHASIGFPVAHRIASTADRKIDLSILPQALQDLQMNTVTYLVQDDESADHS